MIYVGPTGPPRARIMLVGEAPGADEEKEGKPFVGKAGQLLRQSLMSVGIDPNDCWLTNICKYRPPGNKLADWFLDGGVPNLTVLAGLAELDDEILRVAPNVIVALGNFPLWALTGKSRWVDKTVDGERWRGYSGIQDWRGSILATDNAKMGLAGKSLTYKVVPTFHPSYILREGMKDHGTFAADLARVAEQSKFPEIRRRERRTVLASKQPQVLVGFDGVNPIWEPHTEDREEIKRRLLKDTVNDTLTLDIEYIGSNLMCVGVTTDSDSAVVIPTENLEDIFYAESIAMSGIGINAQNSMFDASILEWHYQMPIMSRVTFDTMLAAHAANIELPKGLDYLVSIYTDIPYYKDMVSWPDVKKGKQDRSIVYAYNGIDVYGQHEVMEQQIIHELGDPRVRETFEFEMAMLNPLWNMSKRGVRIDFEGIDARRAELKQDIARLGVELMLMNGSPVNPRPSKSCSAFLYEKVGLPVLNRTKSGPATDDKTLAALQIKAPTPEGKKAVDLIRKSRVALNLGSKFFDIEFDTDGRMRGHYDPSKTVTGRLASRKFYPTGLGTNAQNIPRDKRARRVFVADPGKVFCYADLERAESLVVAQLTGDPRMLRDHGPGVDAHRSLAAALYHIAEEEVTEDQRYIGKKTRHAGNYMQGPLTFMKNFNQDAHKTGLSIDLKEADRLMKLYKSLHPYLPRWWKAVEQELWKTRTLYTLLGRKRTFFGHIQGSLPEAVAFNPQGTVGDVLNIGFLNLEGVKCGYVEKRGIWDRYADIAPELLDCGFEPLMQIHDAIAFQVWEKDLERALPLVQRGMLVPLRNPSTYEDFEIPVEIMADVNPEHLAQGRSNWGDVKVWYPAEAA